MSPGLIIFAVIVIALWMFAAIYSEEAADIFVAPPNARDPFQELAQLLLQPALRAHPGRHDDARRRGSMQRNTIGRVRQLHATDRPAA